MISQKKPFQIVLFILLITFKSMGDLDSWGPNPYYPAYKAAYAEFKVNWHFGAKEFPIGFVLQASFMERNEDFIGFGLSMGYGVNIGVETRGLKLFYLYTELETGFEPVGIAVGPVLKLERNNVPHWGIQGSSWIGIQGWRVLPDVRLRYISDDDSRVSAGLMLKLPFYFWEPVDTTGF